MLFLFVILSVVFAELHSRQSIFQGKSLRILPLGASITWGQGSSDGNGYRQTLRDLLSPAQVTYIGSQCSGDMQNGNNEGHRDYRIDQMESVAVSDLALQPNVILVYVGTNDMLSNQASAAPDSMQQLVDYLVSNLPDALIVVSKLFLDTRPQIAQRIEVFDSELDVSQLGNVMVADMSDLLTAANLGPDGEHPNDSGYAKMAQVFFEVLTQAEDEGRIPSPVSIDYTPSCNGPPLTSSSMAASSAAATSSTSPVTSDSSSSMSNSMSSTTSSLETTSSTISSKSSSSTPSATVQTTLASSSTLQVSSTSPGASETTTSATGTSTTSETLLTTTSTSSTSTGPSVSPSFTSSAHQLTKFSHTFIWLFALLFRLVLD